MWLWILLKELNNHKHLIGQEFMTTSMLTSHSAHIVVKVL
ncbi:hypothetical protein HU200_065441 [Digitaria exilis]|uniref:Uncharacterized protein n=1 Tax=Digitaria exilis TaxID=1010633 RepID=A0A835A9Q2_9POAL|nr:hypothetical protein HU200_065441 [Digitaria exilis]